jgi:Kef-type K+ transport system membrane component KefB
MISRGEMALVVSNVALGAHLIDQNHYTAMIVVTVVTTLIAPVILKALIQHQTAAQRSTQINEVK